MLPIRAGDATDVGSRSRVEHRCFPFFSTFLLILPAVISATEYRNSTQKHLHAVPAVPVYQIHIVTWGQRENLRNLGVSYAPEIRGKCLAHLLN